MSLTHAFQTLRPYLSEIGRVGFDSGLLIIGATLLLEAFAPGIVGNYVVPQHLAAFTAAMAALELLDVRPGAAPRPPVSK